MLVIFSVFDRIQLLPYFLRYYSLIGATQFVCGLHNGETNPLYKEIVNFKSTYDLHIRVSVICNVEQYCETDVTLGMNNIRKEFAAKYGWYCIADLDEFHFFEGKTMLDVAKEADERGYDAVHGVFFDRIAADGTFPEIEPPLDKTFPLVCNLTQLCDQRCAKIVLAKSHIEITNGHHDAKANVWRNVAQVHHFKWAKGVDKVIEDKYIRHLLLKNQWAINKLPMALNLVKNRLNITNPKLNVRQAPIIGI